MSRLEVYRPRESWWERAKRSLRLGPYNSRDPELARIFGGAPTSTGISVTEYTALNFSAVWAAVSLISGDVASLPLVLYKRTGKGKERYDAHPLYRILHDSPNPEMTSVTFRRTLQAHVLTWGNGYAEIERDNGGRPRYLWPITPDRVYVERERGALQYRVSNKSGPDTIFSPMDILHIPGMGYDGVQGYSVISKARESIGLGLAAERFGGTFFGNGASFGGVFEHPAVMSPDAQKRFRASIDAQHQGVEKAHKFLIAEEGMKYQRLGIPPEDAQFLETRQFQVAEVARWFGAPPHKLGDLSRATFSNIEHENIDYHQTTLVRQLRGWEQELMLKLVSPLERNQQVIEHVVEGLLRGDAAGRAEFYSKLFQIGGITINEMRARENLNPVDGGDTPMVPLNMVPLDRLNELLDKQIEAKQGPAPQPPPAKDEPDDDRGLAVALARIEELTVTVTEADIARRVADQRAEDLSAAQAEAERVRDEVRAEYAHAMETLTGAEQALAAEQSERARERSEALNATAEAIGRANALQVERDTARTALDEAEAARDVARGLASAAEAARDVAEQATRAATDTAEAARAEAAAATAEAVGRAEAAAREAAAALISLAEARASAEAAERARTEAEAALTAAQEAVTQQRRQELERLTGVITAHRALIVDAMGRMVRWEVDKARRHQATPEKLRRWLEAFYTTHEDSCFDALLPVVRVHIAWTQSADDPAFVTRELVREHIRESVRQLRAVASSDPEDLHVSLERMLQRWEEDRAAALADRILKDEVDYVRSLHR